MTEAAAAEPVPPEAPPPAPPDAPEVVVAPAGEALVEPERVVIRLGGVTDVGRIREYK